MRTYDLNITNGSVLLPGLGLVHADVLISDGKIAALTTTGAGEASETVSVAGLTVLPGAVDAHIHLGHGMDISRPRTPDDASAETAAAARGGVTTVLSYVMSSDPYLPIFDDLCRITSQGARVDFGFHCVIATEAQLDELPAYIAAGMPSAKLFMNIRGDEGQRLGLPGTDDGFLFRLLETLASHGGVLCPHPENIEVAWLLRDRMLEQDPSGENGLRTWNATRPPFVEADALQRACYFGRVTGTPVHAVHTSSAEALDAAVSQRVQGAAVSIETCLHYLTHDVTSDIGAIGKVNPPLRTPQDREALWHGIANGQIDTIATDHIHRPISSKDGSIWTAQPGFPGLDVFLPALFSEGHVRRGLGLETLSALVSRRPARFMGLPQKGEIRIGADADLAILDMNAPWTVTKEDLATSANYSIYEGQKMHCQVVHTLSRGRFALRDRVLQNDAVGSGQFLHRSFGKKSQAEG